MSDFAGENPTLGNNASIAGSKIIKTEEINLYLTASSTSQVVFLNPIEVVAASPTSPTTYFVKEVRLAFGTASSSGTLQIEHLTGTQASGSGTALLSSAMALSGTANTTVAAVPTSTTAATLGVGDRLGIVIAGTMTGLANCCVMIALGRAAN